MSALAIRFIGSGDAFGSGGRLQTCIHGSDDRTSFLLDCGASSLIGLNRLGVDPSAIDWIACTHLHGDHFAGVPFLLVDARLRGRTRPLTLLLPPGGRARLDEATELLFPGFDLARLAFPLTVVELAPRQPARVGVSEIVGFPVNHFGDAVGAPPLALRVACGGRVVAYSGDTDWTDTLLEASDGADLFIVEAWQLDTPVRFHMDYQALREQRHRITAKRTVLTHLGPVMLARRAELEEPVAEDGLEIRLS